MDPKYFIELLKKNTNVDDDFIKIFLKGFKSGDEINFCISDKEVANALNLTLENIRKRLNNYFTKEIIFLEKVDYIRAHSRAPMYLNYQAFEKLYMNSESPKAKAIREYFPKMRELFFENREKLPVLFQAMENKNDLKNYVGMDSIYFFQVDDRYENTYKVGRTRDIIKRLRSYNVGRVKEVELKYLALVKNAKLIESLVGYALKENRIKENREIYQVSAENLQKLIENIYCSNISTEENEMLYKEIFNLPNSCKYNKNIQVELKPYIVIGKKIIDKHP
jgi:DNA-binding Lrp family transcriptional regulator